MKAVNNVTLRIVFAFLLGLLLIVWPAAALKWLVMTIGILFLIAGLYEVLSYLLQGKESRSAAKFPLGGAGCVLLGLILVSMPGVFVEVLMFILGGVLVLAAVVEIASLVTARTWGTISLWFYVVPVLILICGVIVLCHPFTVAATAFILLGITFLVYAVSEAVNYFKFTRKIH